MDAPRAGPSSADAASGTAAALTGVGILMMALFPFAMPILLLTAAFTAPLVIVGVVAALPLAIVAGFALAIRKIGRWLAAETAARREQSAFEGAPNKLRTRRGHVA